MKKVQVIYSGRVQAVGFRFTAVHLAKEFSVTGWVRNLPNGDVEVVAEADNKALTQFLNSLEDRMSGYIQAKDISWSESKNEFSAFDIRY